MPRLQKTQIVLALAAAFATVHALADDPQQSDGPAPVVQTPPPVSGQAHVTADDIAGTMNTNLSARGNVVVTRDDQRLTADWLDYYQAKNAIKAGDQFILTRQHDKVSGTVLDYNLDSRTGTARQPAFQSGTPGNEMRGTGNEVIFTGKDNYRVIQSQATTCAVDDDSWYLKSSRLDLNYTTGVGTSTNSTIVFQGVPILYSPWLDFSLDGKRKSGFLYPTLQGGSNGTEFSLPYYWNIAPNHDATIIPKINLRHGLIMAGEFRYLQPDYNGSLYTEQLPRDQTSQQYRALWSARHHQQLAPGLTLDADGSRVSDDNYFQDFGDRYTVAANTNLVREATLAYSTNWGNGSFASSLLTQNYQTLQPSKNILATPHPYARLPQLALSINQGMPLGLSTNLTSQFTKFSSPLAQNGQRMVMYPSISLPWMQNWGYITPKLGINYTEYQLDAYQTAQPQTITRSLPIVSLDSGLYFDRQVDFFGATRTQTLQPRLYYLHVPAKDQSNIPNFDSSLNDFGFAQIFAESDYSGYDRLSPANQITAALSSQLIDNDTGREILYGAIGQRFYFDSTQLDPTGRLTKRTTGASDFLLNFGGEVIKNWNLDSLYQYSATTHSPVQYNTTLNYQPAPGKIASFRYHFAANNQLNINGQPENLHQFDLGVQWPLIKRWYGLASASYSIQDRQFMQQILGLEYNEGCWILRLVSQRYITNLVDTKTAFFVQLELKGLGSLGNSPLTALSMTIPGYTTTNQAQ